MLRNGCDSHRGRSAPEWRLTAFAAAVVLLCACGGCRRQGAPGPELYARERAIREAAANRKQEYHPQDRYPWQGRPDSRIGSLPERIIEQENVFRRESDIHHQVIYGGRKHNP